MPIAATTTIFWPLIAQAALTAIVWIALYVTRLGEIGARRIDPQRLRTSRLAAGVLENVAAADNFRNLFEVPVLFFTVGTLLALRAQVSALELALAWAFVGLRAMHSLIHLSYNRVVHRFAVYAASTLAVFALWALLAWDLAHAV
jgi:hypothetical protein